MESANFACLICRDTLHDPVTTECGHTFCSHCICTAFGKSSRSFREELSIPCPICKSMVKSSFKVDEELVSLMEEHGMLMSQHVHAYTGRAATINSTDGNRTESAAVTAILHATSGNFEANVSWGGGSVHNTYARTTCKVTGKRETDGSFKARADYSNGPWEEWSGVMVATGSSLELEKGQYVWHGWDDRRSTGKLEISLTASNNAPLTVVTVALSEHGVVATLASGTIVAELDSSDSPTLGQVRVEAQEACGHGTRMKLVTVDGLLLRTQADSNILLPDTNLSHLSESEEKGN
eukprot:TRINITY_DN108412_c0_g1_i1.p1 TRINITY_DN108412_c0_g1~~TRINITY_DN108412_c0_g1_i1.p1  ORF type:complete len:294 (+),score=37.29 TRINITY_DN108412_c0_g1_i1:132-1013(+)